MCICTECGKEFILEESIYYDDTPDSFDWEDDDDWWEYDEYNSPEDYPDWDGDESIMYLIDSYEEEPEYICDECLKRIRDEEPVDAEDDGLDILLDI